MTPKPAARRKPGVSWYLVAGTLLLLLASMSFAQWRVGLADNGDYTRHMLWVSSGPEGFDENFPKEGTEEWERRFFRHPLADWKLDFPLTSRWVSSVLPLWVPGTLANMLLHSGSELYLPYVSLAARVLTIAFMLLLLSWLRRRLGRDALLPAIGFGLPAALLLGDRNVVAYFTSFYQEPASLLGLLFLASVLLLYRRRGDTPWMPWLLSIAIFGIQAAKLSNVYWAVLVLLFVFPWQLLRTDRRRAALYLVLVFALPLGLSIGQSVFYNTSRVNAYQSLYCGVLAFSDQPQAHLDRLGMPDGGRYIGQHAYGPPGRECMARYGGRLSHAKVLDVIAHEPALAWRMLAFPADSVQRYELTHLGKRLLLNSADTDADEWQEADTRVADLPVFSSWSRLKSAAFPRGNAFLLTLALFALLFVLQLRRGDAWQRDLAWLGLLLTIACATDMWMQIFGDGVRDLIKHLFLVNVLFDVVLVIAVNSVVWGVGRRKSEM